MPKTMREQLEESFETAEKETGGSVEDPKDSVGDSSKTEELPKEETKEIEDGGELEFGSLQEPGSEGDGESKTDKQVSAETDKSGDEIPPDKQEEKGLKAPASWKPDVREHWAKLPKEVQTEVLRREREIDKGLFQASGHRKVAEEYLNVINPYRNLIQAQNSTPAQAITNLMQTAAQLTMGTPNQKAQVISDIIKNYSIDVEILDQVLSGMELPDTDNPILDQIDQRLKPVTDFMSEFQGAQRREDSSITQQADSDLVSFQENVKNEFFEDVREEMADIMELGARHSRVITLEQAYNQACNNNPEIKKILDHREAALRAKPSADELEKKKQAASSIEGGPPTGTKKEKGEGTLRESVLGAIDDLENR